MPLSTGTHLGPYEILGPLGSGGMGEVYRSRDTRLDRLVAIKILPSHLAERVELRERFEREARAVSSLNHPHICTLYDIGHQDGIEFIVMELLEGESLSERLSKGPLPVNQALRVASEIAEGLDVAHRHGVVHRDLKPGNVMLTKSGSKLLDFGLAKVSIPAMFRPVSDDKASASGSAAASNNLTIQGAMLGTLHYMAPEQLDGGEADPRSDIFALGVLIYEMISGEKPFDGKSQASIVAAILDRDPNPLSITQASTPLALDRLIRRCLQKDPDERWQTAKDLAAELKWIAETEAQIKTTVLDTPATQPPENVMRATGRGKYLGWVAAAALFAAAVFFAIPYFRAPSSGTSLIQFTVDTPETSATGHIAISPDGRQLAFVALTPEGSQRLWVRPLDSVNARILQGTESALHPFWSPDSRFVGFFSSGILKKVDINGGAAQTITNAADGAGGTWNREGVIVFTDGATLRRVSSEGGTAVALPLQDERNKETLHLAPFFLPDGTHFLYVARDADPSKAGIFVGALDSKQPQRILEASDAAAYAAPGFLFFLRDDNLMARAFNADDFSLSGTESLLAEKIQRNTLRNKAGFSVSDSGAYAFRNSVNTNRQLTWVDRHGQKLGVLGPPGTYNEWALSPDEQTVAVETVKTPVSETDIWLISARDGGKVKFTLGPGVETCPVWSRDQNHILFASDASGRYDLYKQLSSGGTPEQTLLDKSNAGPIALPDDVSPDGQLLLYRNVDRRGTTDLWILPLTGDAIPFSYTQTASNEIDGQISPDGNWLAYASNETGRYEVYVQSFPTPGLKRQVSTAGGYQPKWRRDGKELFFLSLDSKMMAAAVSPGPSTVMGTPQALFDVRFQRMIAPTTTNRSQYAVSQDGQRFLINIAVEVSKNPITVVVNWLGALTPGTSNRQAR